MVSREVRWTNRAIKDKLLIYEYWAERNQSLEYPKKLEQLINEALNIIALFPNSGRRTDIEGIRVKTVRDYQIFYRISELAIIVITIWDTRQNPKKLTL